MTIDAPDPAFGTERGRRRVSRRGRYNRLDPFSSGRVTIGPEGVRFGQRHFAPGEILVLRIESEEKSAFIGNICAFAIFLGLASMILQAIVGQIFPYRTLIGVVTLGCVGLASMQDTWWERGSGFFSLFVTTAASAEEILVFATSDRQEIEQVAVELARVLPASGVPVTPATASATLVRAR